MTPPITVWDVLLRGLARFERPPVMWHDVDCFAGEAKDLATTLFWRDVNTLSALHRVADAFTNGLAGRRAQRSCAKPQRSGRSRSWPKTRRVSREEFVVVGWTDPRGSRPGLGSLLLAYYDGEGTLIYAGRVGTGFPACTLLHLRRRLAELARSDASLHTDLLRSELRAVHWVRPELVVKVEFTEWTRDGTLRYPSFKGIRHGKPARGVTPV
jgi:bifunctional non-homologous end joining protein LigD